ncbi:MAG TPA: hypothetical protein VIC35_03415 [Acidimicrobiia bacterium]|jgi:hypothetical protein
MIPKRLFWLTVGYGAGVGSSLYAAHRVRVAARRMSADHLASRVSDTVTGTVRDVRAAVSEGREAMRAREAELKGRA